MVAMGGIRPGMAAIIPDMEQGRYIYLPASN